MKLKPAFRYIGTKTGTSLQDACLILKHYIDRGYRLIEPFCGSASVSIACQPNTCILADLQPHAILTLQVLRSRPIGLMRAYGKYRDWFLDSPTRDKYYRLRNNPPDTPIERAAWFIFITHGAFNWLWRVNQKGQCTSTYGGEAGIQRIKKALPRENTLALATWLDQSNRQIKHSDAFSIIQKTGADDVIYVDPPYISKFDSYCKEKFRFSGHIKLQSALHKSWQRGAHFVLHCSANEEIAAMYKGFCNILLRNIKRRMAGGNHMGKGLNDWEMIITSKEKQCELFPSKQPEESEWYGGTIKPTWNEQEGRWETWIQNLSSS